MLKLTDTTVKNAKRAKRLTDPTVKTAAVGEHSDAQTPGLSLLVRSSTSKARPKALRRSWAWRYTFNGKRQKLGLGAYPATTLEDARRKAREAAAMVAKGLNPLVAHELRTAPETMTFSEATEAYLLEALPRYPSDKSKSNLRFALGVHCAPFASRRVLEIGTRDVANLLKGIAADTPAMAEKVRAALRGLFSHVALDMEDRGVVMRNPLTPAGLKAAHYIPASPKSRHAALDPTEAPEFMRALRAISSTDARLLEFVILTVARAGAARLARLDQIDVESAVWRVPAAQMKDGRFRKGEPFVVPLVPRALEIVEGMRRPGASASAFIFEAAGDKPLNDTALVSLVRRMCRGRQWIDPSSKKPITTHGFRSSFRTWCQMYRRDREVVEIAMGHRFHGAVESRYARGDLLNERRELLNEWASYCLGQDTIEDEDQKVVQLRRAQ
jgi:integrase